MIPLFSVDNNQLNVFESIKLEKENMLFRHVIMSYKFFYCEKIQRDLFVKWKLMVDKSFIYRHWHIYEK